MEDSETPQMHKYGESKTTQILMATVRHVTSRAGCMKFQAARVLLYRVYILYVLLYITLPSHFTLSDCQVQVQISQMFPPNDFKGYFVSLDIHFLL